MAKQSVTHIIKKHPSSDSEFLFRWSDGMMIGFREKVTVIYGDDPNRRVSRVFIDSDSAARYLRDGVAGKDFEGPVRFEVSDMESLIVQPGKAFAIPDGSSIRRMS